MTNKRKHIDMIAPTYEEGWASHVARQQKWVQTEQYVVYASPAACIARITQIPLPEKDYFYIVDSQEANGAYEFKVAFKPRAYFFERRGPGIQPVIGHITKQESETQKSVITLRTYPPGNIYFDGLAIFVSIIPLSTIGSAWLLIYGTQAPLQALLFIIVCVFVIIGFMVAFSYKKPTSIAQQTGLDLVLKQLSQINQFQQIEHL